MLSILVIYDGVNQGNSISYTNFAKDLAIHVRNKHVTRSSVMSLDDIEQTNSRIHVQLAGALTKSIHIIRI